MVSDLTVRGGGAVSVETETLALEAARLAVVEGIVDGWARRAGEAARRLRELGPASSPGAERAAADLDTARAGFASGAAAAAELGTALRVSAARYGAAEWFAAMLTDAGQRLAAGALGLAAPVMLTGFASAAALAAPGLALGAALAGPEATAAGLRALVERYGLPLLSDPAFVDLVRASVDHVDEFLAALFRAGGVFGLGAGIDAPESAGILLGVATAFGIVTGSRALRETDVRVTRVAEPDSALALLGPRAPSTPAPRGVADLADRIPAGPPGDPQIRIERYDGADGPRWIVYSSGTVDFGVVPGAEPYDSTSNLHTVADASERSAAIGLVPDPGAAERSVRDAMAAAGVAPGDPVLVVGHSAGGIIAANLAADADLRVVGAVSLGGPVAQVPSGSTPVLSVEHAEDLVPATGGAGVAADGRLVVERGVGPVRPTTADPLPAHALTAYRETAERIDEADDPRLVEFRRLVDDLTDGRPASTTFWHAERSPALPTTVLAPGDDLSRAGAPPGR